jgi:delta14-sterol reductase
MATFQAIACYAASFQHGKLFALGGNSGNPIYDVRRVSSMTPLP